MYKIFHNIDSEKITTLNNDGEFVYFMRQIAIENGDENLSITCLGEAKDYLNNYCGNLTLLSYEQNKLITLIESENFKDAIKDGIKSGKDWEYFWNGETETTIDTFDEGTATNEVIKIIKEKILGYIK